MKKLSLLLISVFSFIINTNAQISTKEEPISFSYDQSQASIVYKSIDKRTLPVLDMEAINREDAEDEKYNLPSSGIQNLSYKRFIERALGQTINKCQSLLPSGNTCQVPEFTRVKSTL